MMFFARRKKAPTGYRVTKVEGIGEEYGNLLGAAGVDTVKQLRYRNPAKLTARLAEVNRKKSIVRRPPTEATVERWVRRADKLYANQNSAFKPAAKKAPARMPRNDN